jgi:hypothetical protein
MEDRPSSVPPERPVPAAPAAGDHDATEAAALADPRALTILTTEHWSLLSGRSLVYNEAFSRAGMFLSFLAATLVALGLMAGGMGFDQPFFVIAALLLALDLFIGLATMGRVATSTNEDIRYLQAMNRVRHAYHEMVPGLDHYFVTGRSDDIAGVFGAYGTQVVSTSLRSIAHGFTTVAGMLGVINAALAGVLAATLVLVFAGGDAAAVAIGLATFALGLAVGVMWGIRSVAGTVLGLDVRFPTPPGDTRR